MVALTAKKTYRIEGMGAPHQNGDGTHLIFTGGKDYVLTKITKEYMWFETELGQIGFNSQGEGPDCVNSLFDEDELTFAKLKVGIKEI